MEKNVNLLKEECETKEKYEFLRTYAVELRINSIQQAQISALSAMDLRG